MPTTVVIRNDIPCGFGSRGEIYISRCKCEVCDKDDVVCLRMDSSEGEYGDIAMCKPCTDAAFERFERE